MISIGPDNSLVERLTELGDISTYSTELSSEEKVGVLFPDPPSDEHLHILVQRPEIVPSSLSGE